MLFLLTLVKKIMFPSHKNWFLLKFDRAQWLRISECFFTFRFSRFRFKLFYEMLLTNCSRLTFNLIKGKGSNRIALTLKKKEKEFSD